MDKNEAKKIIKNSFKLCKKYDNMLSRTDPGSEIYKINHAKGKFTKLNKDSLFLLTESLKMSSITEGRFDISLGKLTNLWNITSDNPKVPKKKEVERLLPTVGYNNIQIKNTFVSLGRKGTWLDLGAIAKGYIGDKISHYMKKNGVKSAIINLGGNIIIIGGKEKSKPWNIGIEAPYSNGRKIVTGVKVKNKSIVTSGVYERYIEEKGKKYHHILDPKTGWPVQSDLLAVSIVGPVDKSWQCDALSTSCLLLGKTRAKRLMNGYPEFGFLTIDKNNKIETGGKWPEK
mgnify:CR=1 FL=1